jgi:hypothetical protein
MKMIDIDQNPQQSTLIRALNVLFKPLVRLMIRKGITFPLLRDLLKQVYVDQARELIENDGESVSFSRLYILTGIHRKDIKRLSEEAPDTSAPLADRTLSAQLIATWLGLPEYCDSRGEPLALPFNGDGDTPGFVDLVTSVSKDIRPRAMLDEWLRQGVVIQTDEFIALNQNAFVPSGDFDQLSDYFARHIHDHVAACAHNLQGEKQPMFERSVYYPRLTEQSIAQLQQQAEQQGGRLLMALNNQARRLYEQDKDEPDATRRFRFGCYWFDEENKSCDQ